MLQAFHEQEAELALQDKRQQDTADRKNELEAYVYSLRGKLADSLAPYAPAPAREALTQRLNDMEVCGNCPLASAHGRCVRFKQHLVQPEFSGPERFN